MDLNTFLAAAQAEHDATEVNKRGAKTTTREEALADGRKVLVEMATSESRGWKSRGKSKTAIRFKLDGKVIARAALEAELSGRAANWYETLNPELRAEFEAQAPILAASMKDYLLRLWGIMVERHPDGVPAHPERADRGDTARMQALQPVVMHVPGSGEGMHWRNAKVQLDDAALVRYCDAYGMEAALQWFYKTNAKLGELSKAELVEDAGGEVIVLGERHGKAIRFAQQRIINTSPKGKAFHQFPSRIYVDGKFTPDAAYQKAMLLADLAA